MQGNIAIDNLKIDPLKDLKDSIGSIAARLEHRLKAAGPHDADCYTEAAWHLGSVLQALEGLK